MRCPIGPSHTAAPLTSLVLFWRNCCCFELFDWGFVAQGSDTQELNGLRAQRSDVFLSVGPLATALSHAVETANNRKTRFVRGSLS